MNSNKSPANVLVVNCESKKYGWKTSAALFSVLGEKTITNIATWFIITSWKINLPTKPKFEGFSRQKKMRTEHSYFFIQSMAK